MSFQSQAITDYVRNDEVTICLHIELTGNKIKADTPIVPNYTIMQCHISTVHGKV